MFLKLLLVLRLIVFVSSSNIENPRTEKTNYGRRQYILYNNFANFTDAIRSCQNDYEGNLAMIKSNEENQAVLQLLKKRIKETISPVYFGIKRFNLTTWIYLDGTPVPQRNISYGSNSYQNWHSDEPNNINKNEDCGALYFDGRWNDARCDRQRQYICERDTFKCKQQKILYEGSSYTFNETNVNDVAVSTQTCKTTGFPMAAISCNLRGFFDLSTLDIISCNVTLNSLSNTTEGFKQLAVITTKANNFTQAQFDLAFQHFDLSSRNLMESINEKEFNAAVSTVDNLLNQRTSNSNDTFINSENSALLVASLQHLANNLSFPENKSTFKSKSRNIEIQFKRVNENEAEISNQINFQLQSKSSNIKVSVTIEPNKTESTSINNNQYYFIGVASGQPLFNEEINRSQIVIVGATNVDISNVKFLLKFDDLNVSSSQEASDDNSLKIEEKRVDIATIKQNHWVICRECIMRNSSPPEYEIRRIGSYTLLFSSRTVPSTAALSIVSYVGIGISSLSLLATVFIYLIIKKLRTKPTTAALINISVLLFIIYFVFAVGIGNISHEPLCYFSTIILHFSFLSCFSWMTLNAVLMYRAFTSMNFIKTTNNIYFYILTYGLSFIAVLINASITLIHIDPRRKLSTDIKNAFFESSYKASFMCWLNLPSLYWGFLLPVGVMTFTNFCIFFALLKKVVFNSQKEIRSTARFNSLHQRLTNALVMFSIMGLTWIFGYFLLIPKNLIYEEVFQWLFTIFNSLQGLVIFILFCFRSKEVRKLWLGEKFAEKFSFKKKEKPAITKTSEGSKLAVDKTQQTNLLV